jgi:molybdate transport system substrate-binding protein
MKAVPAALALGAFVVTLAAGCGAGTSAEAGGARVTVLAAASLAEVLPGIDARPRYVFGGSNELALQVREGAPADVYAAASARFPAELHAEGLVERPQVFATNRLVLVVPRENPAGIGSVLDLRRRPARLVVAAAGVPAGDYTREALRRLGALDVLDRVVSEEHDVKGVVGKVALGEADAGFAYATDVAPVAARVRALELPARARPRIEYLVAVVSGSGRRAAAAELVEALLGPAGRAALREAGFGLP